MTVIFSGFKRNLACLVALHLLLPGCGSEAPVITGSQSVDTTILSRGVEVPVTWVIPESNGDTQFPLVVLVHGHGGSRNEAGAYPWLADELARQGLASIRMDFPGCGDSSEPFANNNLTNMLADIAASRDFALSLPGVDANRVGLHGFSMGGRLGLMTVAGDNSYKALGTWAPAGQNGAASMIEFVGGDGAWEEMKEEAINSGYAQFTTFWGQDQQLGQQFFEDMESSKPLDAAAKLSVPLMVLYGDQDTVVLPEVCEAVIDAAQASPSVVRHVIEGADHGLGIFSEEPHYTEEAIATTVAFFKAHL